MSSTLHKIADKLTGKDKHVDNPNSSNAGPHSSAAANKLDPRVDSDADGRNDPTSRVGGYGDTQAVGTHPTTGYAGTTTHTGTGASHGIGGTHQSTNAGPHNSNLANKLDPRVDSDRDGRGNVVGGHGVSHTQHSTTPAYTGANVSHNNPQSTNAGPHSSNILNTLDPRVDSDRDGRNDPTSHTGGYGQTQTGTVGTTGYGNTATHTTGATPGYTSTNTTYDGNASTNAGPHSSNLMNKLDPRVDSDRDGRNDPTSRVGGYGETQTGVGHNTGYTAGHTAGHTTTGVGGTTGYNTTGHSTTGAQGYTGTHASYDNPQATNTGPHSSNLLNKLDPRVDSDRDGRNDPTSRTGGYGETQTGGPVGRY